MLKPFLAFIIFCASLAGQSPGPEQLAPIFAKYQHSNTPGCAVAVESPGNNVWTAAYGMADLEHAVANTTTTVFEAGSVSKQFTAAAVLLLAERHQLTLDDDIRKYFPELPNYGHTITVRHLLNHTSGLRDWGEIEEVAGWERTTRVYTHAHVLDILSRQRSLNYMPGDAWSYTNSGYNLSAMLVERLTGMSLQTFCRKEFFEPLGMDSTQWRDDFRRIVPQRAVAYDLEGSAWQQLMPFEDVYGNGGLLTTVDDLLKWNRNLSSGKLHPELFQQMQQPGSLNNGTEIRYGFGLFLESFQDVAEISHAGATAGYRAWLGRMPSKGLSIALLCNAGSANTSAMARHIEQLYLGVSAPAPAVSGVITPGLYRNQRDQTVIAVDRAANDRLTFDGHPVQNVAIRFAGQKMFSPNPVYGEDVWERVEQWHPSDPASFLGVYSSDEAETVLRVVLENGKLVIRRRPNASFTLKPTAIDSFQCPLGSVRFLRDPAGNITALSLAGSRVWDLRFARVQHPPSS
jgi:CubicO group peptidase (beta-lactamase class C family)